jgi:hypothetical protein
MLAAALVSNQQQVVGVCKQICWGFKLLLPACWLLDYTGFQVLNASCIPAFKTAEQLEVASFCELADLLPVEQAVAHHVKVRDRSCCLQLGPESMAPWLLFYTASAFDP